MKKWFLPLSIAGTLFLSACQTYSGGIRYQDPYYHPANPPAHAPAHGVRKKYHYRYYPEAGFYFDTGRNVYFYLDSSGNWSVSATLPNRLRVYLQSNHVQIEMESDRPYLKHRYHKKRYPPGQYKKRHAPKGKYKKKNKGKGKGKSKKYRDNEDDRKGSWYRGY
jgi:hypothetical protein